MIRSLYNASFRTVFTFLLACFVALTGTGSATADDPISVAILGSPSDPAGNNDVQAKLVSTGVFSSVDIIDIGFVTPSLAQLSTYDSVLVYSDHPYQDAVTLGNNLADYVDAGGGVVVAVFANASIPFGGRFNTDNYWGIIPGPQTQFIQLTLGTIHDPGSPLLDGVTAFDGGSMSYRSTGVLHPSAVSVADWSDGSPLVVSRVINGTPRVDLNFHPPSSDVRFDLWLANTDGARLMANALLFTAGPPPPPPPPPGNDDFANATPISALPFNDTVNTTSASLEAGEPTSSCVFPAQSNTVWYAFTPDQSGSVSAFLNAPFPIVMAVYTGDSLADLTEMNCNFLRMTFQVEAGVTYYFQVGSLFDLGGPLQFGLEVTPSPVANFSFFPIDPSVFDTIQFFDQSFDPGGVGLQLPVWDFGDGTTATDCCPVHQYAADGDYTVQLTVTTFDGRTASTSQLVQVRTHDVAITKFSAPQAASAGQTRHISVGINSKRYPETVQVDLLKSVPGGFEFVGTLVQSVPVRSGNRTTDFNFSYTFTSGDASIGKVTFKAVATILNTFDELPADNEAVASPTKVNFPADRQFTNFIK